MSIKPSPLRKGAIEAFLLKEGHRIAGVDEVGRGCLAGPVYAAAVILDYEKLKQLSVEEKKLIRDSKTLSAKQRQKILPIISEIALASACGQAEVSEIEEQGIVPATFLAMHRSLFALQLSFSYLLIDGKFPLPGLPQAKQQAVIKGDSLCYSIAAASILAKEKRDAYMSAVAEKYPQYLFEKNVGYGTAYHLKAIQEFGICELHRKNFRMNINAPNVL